MNMKNRLHGEKTAIIMTIVRRKKCFRTNAVQLCSLFKLFNRYPKQPCHVRIILVHREHSEESNY